MMIAAELRMSIIACVGCSMLLLLGGAMCCPEGCDCRDSYVNCSRMDLDTLPDGIPRNTTWLILEYNEFTNIPPALFKPFTNLTQLSLSGNQLRSTGLTVASFVGLDKLQNLDLSYNKLTRVPGGLPASLTYLYLLQTLATSQLDSHDFVNLTNLVHLDLSFNRFNKVPMDLYKSQVNLDTLYMDWNPNLTDSSMPVGMFQHLHKLATLSFRGCNLTQVLTSLPTTLKGLDLSFNDIHVVKKDDFVGMTALETLAIWNSSVKLIADGAFRALSKLRILTLNENQITSLSGQTFSQLANVDTIDISENEISKIDNNAFMPLKNLTTLWMCINNIETLSPQTLNGTGVMPKLQTAYLWANRWHCDCRIRWLREMLDHPRFTIDGPGSMKCSAPDRLKGRTFANLKPSDFVC